MDGDLFANLPQHTRHQGNHLPTLATSKPQPAADRSAILGFLDRPRTAKAVADHIGRRLSATTKRLEVLVERRLAVTTRHGLYVRTKVGKLRATASAAELRVSSSEPLEKREKILAFLNKKRATVEVAAHIGLTRDTTSRPLADMGRRYLVVRVGWGIWLRADCHKANSGDTDVAGTTTKPTRPQPIRDAILAYLVEPKSTQAAFPGARINCAIEDAYRNIDSCLGNDRRSLELLERDVADFGIEPKIFPLRRGTDGAALSARGIPTSFVPLTSAVAPPSPTPMSLGVVAISYAQVSSPPPCPLTVPSLRVGEPDVSAIACGRTSN